MPVILSAALKFLFSYYKIPNLARVTGITSKALNAYKSLGKVPSPGVYKKLYNTYRSTTYTLLRYSGASRVEANRFKGGNPLRILEIAKKYEQTVKRLSDKYGVESADIINGMSMSEKDSETIFESA